MKRIFILVIGIIACVTLVYITRRANLHNMEMFVNPGLVIIWVVAIIVFLRYKHK